MGRKLGIKATVPVYYNEQMIGFVEVVSFFESTQEYFDRLGIDMYILMEERFYDTAVFMQENPAIGKEYILANTKYTQSDLKLLENIDFKTFKNSRILYQQGRCTPSWSAYAKDTIPAGDITVRDSGRPSPSSSSVIVPA